MLFYIKIEFNIQEKNVPKVLQLQCKTKKFKCGGIYFTQIFQLQVQIISHSKVQYLFFGVFFFIRFCSLFFLFLSFIFHAHSQTQLLGDFQIYFIHKQKLKKYILERTFYFFLHFICKYYPQLAICVLLLDYKNDIK